MGRSPHPDRPKILEAEGGAQRQLVQRVGEGVHLIVELRVREGADFIEKRLIPVAAQQFDISRLRLRGRRLGARRLVAGDRTGP